jgi:hypothetical protein
MKRTPEEASSSSKRVKVEEDADLTTESDVDSNVETSDEEYVDEEIDIDEEEDLTTLPPIVEENTSNALPSHRYVSKYLETLRQHHVSKVKVIPDHKAFEIAWAIKMGYIMYDDVPPNFIRACGIQDTRDFGTDLVSHDKKGSAQVKLYGDSTSVDFTDMAKFYTHSDLLGAT